MLDMSSGNADFEQTLLDNDLYDAVDALESWDLMGYVENEFKQVRKEINEFRKQPTVDENIEDRVAQLEKKQKGLLKHINIIEDNISKVKTMLEEIPTTVKKKEGKTKKIDEYDRIMYQ
jgi:predicted RNase H-like nuclease (RuvC/YqgF family)